MAGMKQAIKKEIKNIKRELILADIAFILIGIFIIVFPEGSGNILCRIIGGALTVLGVIHAVSYFSGERTEVFGSFALVQGAALIGFGVYFLIKPEFLASILTVCFAIILLVGGVMKLQYGADLARLEASGWWFEIAGAVLMVIFGIVSLVNPFPAAATLMMFIGIAVLINGIWDLISVLYLATVVKKVSKLDSYVETEAIDEDK